MFLLSVAVFRIRNSSGLSKMSKGTLENRCYAENVVEVIEPLCQFKFSLFVGHVFGYNIK